MPDHEATKYAELLNTHKATRPLQTLTPTALCEWAWQNNLITFVEMIALLNYLKEIGVTLEF